MNFRRSSRRPTPTRGRPETPPPNQPRPQQPYPPQQPYAPQPPYAPQQPPAYPPQPGDPNRGDAGYPPRVPPTLPARPPGDPRYPDPNYPPAYPPQTPPGYPPAYPPGGYPQQPAQPPPPVVHRVPPEGRRRARPKPKRRFLRFRPGCLLPLLLLMLLAGPLALYFLAPIRTNLTVIGIDYVDPATGSALARSDTIMIATIVPSKPYVGMISIPRDLWVTIPNVGENRINTAHFYAEGIQPGSGPAALRETIALNFGVDIPYYVRIRFEAFREIVDAMGGVDIELDAPMAGYPAGKHHLTGRKALAFVRNRADSDDFIRMGQGQVMVRALFKNLLNPLKWPRVPAVARAFFASVDTNIPTWMWPRLGLALLRAGPSGIDSHIINREMASPFTTSEGAMVLNPNWPAIHTLVQSVFR